MNDLEKGPSHSVGVENLTIQAKCPLGLLENPDAEKLNCWLSRFIVEARRKDAW